jgi:hypothetical protein
LADWLANRWLVAHQATADEIADLFAIVDRDLEDAAIPRLSSDWRVGITYNAALQLATLALAAEGYRPGRERAHERAILSLRDTVGLPQKTVDLLDVTRRKRNQVNYEHAGSTSPSEAQELFGVVSELRATVVRWLRKKHPALWPPDIKP